jgi:hypothetical protein
VAFLSYPGATEFKDAVSTCRLSDQWREPSWPTLFIAQQEVIDISRNSGLLRYSRKTDSFSSDWAAGSTTGARFPSVAGIFLFPALSRPALGHIKPPIQWVSQTIPSRVKRAKREADHLHPSRAVNAWTYTSTLPNVFMSWCLVKQTSLSSCLLGVL